MLSDYRVLDLCDERGALCGQLLADLGAQVVRLEPPGGSSMRAMGPNAPVWEVYARNCTSLVIDVTTDSGRQQFIEHAANADLVVDTGELAAAGFDYPKLRVINPRLVWVSITAFGATGAKSGYQATDLIVQAASGSMAITGYHDSKPLRTGAITAWSHAGVAAAGGALLALRSADQTGHGQFVDISAQQACNLAASYSLLTAYVDASRFGRTGNVGGGTIPLIWPAKDGFVSMTMGFAGPMIGFTNNFLKWLHDERAITDALANLDWAAYIGALRTTNDPSQLNQLIESIGAFFAQRSKAELLDGALRCGALIVPVSTTHDLLDSPQLKQRGFWWETNGLKVPGPFAQFSARPLQLVRGAPMLDDHPQPLYRPRTRPSVDPATERPLPLAGVRILDFTWVMAGPWSSRVMADYGATVIKVESATRLDLVRILGPFYGDRFSTETSASFASINAGKHSLAVDPGTPEGKATILELVDWADIVMESFSPKAMKKWGLDYATLKIRKPNLIMLSTCLFGQTGPYSTMAGYGTMGAALGGLSLPTGEPGRAPCGPFGPYTDYVAPRFSVVALLAALHHRDRTGEGQHIDQSQAESAMHYLSLAVARASQSPDFPDRLGNTDASMSPHDVFRCAGDDQWLAIAIRSDADWRNLVDEVGAGLAPLRDADLRARRASADLIARSISNWCAPQNVLDVEARLQRIGVPAHAVENASIVKADAQLTQREHFVRCSHAQLGDVFVESVGYRFSDMRARVGKVPSLGGDTDWVMREILGR
jgi:crotonobetainyl-CoA:carnitine CoA-transferase CaiB-like acyl-CoA transferase